MTSASFSRLEEVVLDPLFPEVDLALRAGRHVDRDDGDRYSFLVDAQELLEPFYRRYGCELTHATEGYFYLLPSGDRLGRRHLTAGEMLVGQTLALLYLDPATVQSGGVVPRAQLVARLEGLIGRQRLVVALNPRRKRYDERIAEETVRIEIDKALRALAALGFVDLQEEGGRGAAPAARAERLRVRAPVLRFAEPVRGLGDRAEALGRLVAEGKVALGDPPPAGTDEEEEEP
ncbi:chromosome partition protein MukE [Sorangium cellulosum]|uniref:Condensin subunit E n=1 Tax=Sorangium cellulosum So0157-2 TaxID=1254432 RepID=S4XVI7_SORCE|nr:condensin subunit E [Sorangium cellulosum]AGP36474.1 hypothetical protein SCE1572_19430 [Sorangium cellulosum So0157-2]